VYNKITTIKLIKGRVEQIKQKSEYGIANMHYNEMGDRLVICKDDVSTCSDREGMTNDRSNVFDPKKWL